MNLENLNLIKKETFTIKKELDLDNDIKIKPNLHDIKVKIEPKWDNDVKFWQLESKIKSEKIKSECKDFDIINVKQEIQVIKTEEINFEENRDFNEDYTLEKNNLFPNQSDTTLDRNEVYSNCLAESLHYLNDFNEVTETNTGSDTEKELNNQCSVNLKSIGKVSRKCYMCNDEYASLFSLLLHKSKFCRQKLKIINLLKRHLKTCLRKKYRCDICRRSYMNKSYLKTHLFMHIGKRPFNCKKCHESFFVYSRLQKHIKIHTNENNQCENLNYERNTENNILQYQISRKRPFQCIFCDMYFNIRAHLMTHLKFHLKENIFHCSVCQKSFNRKSMLQKHENCHRE